MSEANVKIYDDIRATFTGTNRYQQTIPLASQVGLERVNNLLFLPQNGDLFNAFQSVLVNQIGNMIIRSKTWLNPISDLKRYNSFMGQSIEEVGMGLLQLKGYDPKKMDLFAPIQNPEVKAAFHSLNVELQAAFTMNTYQLQRAMKTGADLTQFMAAQTAAAETTFNLSEYTITKELFAKHDAHWGIFNVQTPDLNADNATIDDVKNFLIDVKTMIGDWKFPKTLYNAYEMPTFSNQDEVVLLTTPKIAAKIEVLVLSAAFNVSFAELKLNVKVIDEIPIPNCMALMFDADAVIYSDVLNNVEYFRNPKTMSNDYYYNRASIASISPMLNMVKFTTSAVTAIPAVVVTPTAFTMAMYKEDDTVETTLSLAIENYLKAELAWTIVPATEGVLPQFDPAMFVITDITRNTGTTEIPVLVNIPLTNRTYVDNHGLIHLQSDVEVGDIIGVTGTTTYNSDGVGTTAFTTATADYVVVA